MEMADSSIDDPKHIGRPRLMYVFMSQFLTRNKKNKQIKILKYYGIRINGRKCLYSCTMCVLN